MRIEVKATNCSHSANLALTSQGLTAGKEGKEGREPKEQGGSALDWAALVVVHLHATLRHVRGLLPSLTEGLELWQAACTASQLFKALSLVASANDKVRVTFGDVHTTWRLRIQRYVQGTD